MNFVTTLVLLTFGCVAALASVLPDANVGPKAQHRVGSAKYPDELLVPEGKYPYMVRLGTTFACSGAFITPQWILTAAHCVIDEGDASEWVILYGSANTSHGYFASVIKTVQHPNFYVSWKNKAARIHYVQKNDIALIKVNSRFDYPVVLSINKLKGGDVVSIVGYGNVRFGNQNFIHNPTDLREVEAVIWGPCQSDQICTTNSTESANHGDSGGPVIKDNLIYGVISAFLGDVGISSQFVTVIEPVAKYMSWIECVTNEYFPASFC